GHGRSVGAAGSRGESPWGFGGRGGGGAVRRALGEAGGGWGARQDLNGLAGGEAGSLDRSRRPALTPMPPPEVRTRTPQTVDFKGRPITLTGADAAELQVVADLVDVLEPGAFSTEAHSR
ncbi:MAG: hypothetical protein OXH52_01950, partial [Gammaproteobacteria bacterium]|nr:hypothetical protein [Gammaproteobacteria bacterium]